MNYEQSMRELEQIIGQMENNDLDLDKLTEQLQRAKTLIKQCKERLTKTDEEVKRLLAESNGDGDSK